MEDINDDIDRLTDVDPIPLSAISVTSEQNDLEMHIKNEVKPVEIMLGDISSGLTGSCPISSSSDVKLELKDFEVNKTGNTKLENLMLDDSSCGVIDSDPVPSSSSVKSEPIDFEIKAEEEIKQEELILDDSSSSSHEEDTVYSNICQGIIGQPKNKTTGSAEKQAKRNSQTLAKIVLKKKKVTPPYKCKECDFQTMYRSNFYKHAVNHKDENEIRWFYCAQCDYKATQKTPLISHILFKHKDANQIDWYRCAQCDYKSKLKSTLRTHVLIHKRINDNEGFQCRECDYKTKLKSFLRKHALIHKDKSNVFRCNECKFETKYKHSIKKHTLVHKDVKKIEWFPCPDCDYKGKLKIHLTNHIIRKHNKLSEEEWFQGAQRKDNKDHKNTKKRKSPKFQSIQVSIRKA